VTRRLALGRGSSIKIGESSLEKEDSFHSTAHTPVPRTAGSETWCPPSHKPARSPG
jgi:hypothetical protein